MRTIPIPPGMETELFVLESGALASLPEALKKSFPGRNQVILVTDENTYAAAGKKAAEILRAAGFGVSELEHFPAAPFHAQESISQAVAPQLTPGAIPVAVGSGTINDIVKRASFLAGTRYCCVPTATSVDGYTSFGAALLVNGMKKTMPCPAPLAVVADVEVLRSAPQAMGAAGFADLAAKLTGGADWLMTDAAGIEPIAPPVWDLVQKELRRNLEDPADLERLFLGLAATGYAMQLYRDSRPASGAEHLVSHVLEMEKFNFNGKDVSHGFQVAVGTVAVFKLMEFVMNTPVAEARKMAAAPETLEVRKANIAKLLKRGCYGETATVALAKFLEPEAMLARREKLFSVWEEIRRRYRSHLWSSAEMISRLHAAHCPALPEEIGLASEALPDTLRRAQLIRKRYTVLDLLYECGLLDTALKVL